MNVVDWISLKVPSTSEAGEFNILIPDSRTFQDERVGIASISLSAPMRLCQLSWRRGLFPMGHKTPSVQAAASSMATSGPGMEK